MVCAFTSIIIFECLKCKPSNSPVIPSLITFPLNCPISKLFRSPEVLSLDGDTGIDLLFCVDLAGDNTLDGDGEGEGK